MAEAAFDLDTHGAPLLEAQQELAAACAVLELAHEDHMQGADQRARHLVRVTAVAVNAALAKVAATTDALFAAARGGAR